MLSSQIEYPNVPKTFNCFYVPWISSCFLQIFILGSFHSEVTQDSRGVSWMIPMSCRPWTKIQTFPPGHRRSRPCIHLLRRNQRAALRRWLSRFDHLVSVKFGFLSWKPTSWRFPKMGYPKIECVRVEDPNLKWMMAGGYSPWLRKSPLCVFFPIGFYDILKVLGWSIPIGRRLATTGCPLHKVPSTGLASIFMFVGSWSSQKKMIVDVNTVWIHMNIHYLTSMINGFEY